MNTIPVQAYKQRGHIRSASLENANSLISKNTIGLPVIQQPGSTGTLKSRNEQKRLRNKFGSHSNLEDYVTQSRTKFQSIRQMFEPNKTDSDAQQQLATQSQLQQQQQQQQQQIYPQQYPSVHQQYQQQYQQQYLHHHHHHQITTFPAKTQILHNRMNTTTPTSMGCANAAVEFNDRLNIVELDSHSTSASEHINCGENADQATNLLRPIAFKPIPFEPDYSIPNRYIDAGDRYGSTPSLAPVQGSSYRFGSTSDLRHGFSSNSYCSSLLARRRCSRSLKINDSMESIRQTPDSDATSQSSTLKSICSINKYIPNDQFDMTPSPSDSGISELEAALKDRDSELSYLRQTMEHNEKDKEEYWENETKRLKAFYESQQREYLLKMKKMEQLLTLQSFQFKQNKLRISENSNRLKDQFTDLRSENELLRAENENLKSSERAMRECVMQLEDRTRVMDNSITTLKSQLEENEWTVCQKNGEIALLKTQLKEANVELTMKEHEMLHLKHENNNDSLAYQSINGNINNNNNKLHEFEHPTTQQIIEQTNQNQSAATIELNQLNRIVILKDQVILALTNELGKLRKELSDLAIFHEYGEKPSGKLTRLKYQIDNLSNICNNSKKSLSLPNDDDDNLFQNKAIDDTNLELIMNSLKVSAPLCENDDHRVESSSELKLIQMPTVIQNFLYETATPINLPDVTQNLNHTNNAKTKNSNVSETRCEKIPLDHTNNPLSKNTDEVEMLQTQLQDVRNKFEIEKRQWAEEKEKVLTYQRQLQMHYINMYHKMITLDSSTV